MSWLLVVSHMIPPSPKTLKTALKVWSEGTGVMI